MLPHLYCYPFHMFGKTSSKLFILLLALAAPLSSYSQDKVDGYRGWNYLAKKLIADGLPRQYVSAAFNDERLPPFDFVPFKLKPKETADMYADHISDSRIKRAKEYLESYKTTFAHEERVYGVNRYVIAAIHSIETGCGKILGQELVFNRLARIASASDPANMQRNFEELQKDDPTVTIEDVKKRAIYLDETFYPEVKTLLQESMHNKLPLFDLKGSYGGAFGIGQFLPKAFQKFGTDGNNNGLISLFEPEDAIFSTAKFLHSFGWKESLPPGDKLKVLWQYNRSDPYGRMVIKVAVLLRQQ